MQKCNNCGISVIKKPLQRVNEFGDIGIWWCESCIKNEEPELYRNIQEDKSDLEKDLNSMFYK